MKLRTLLAMFVGFVLVGLLTSSAIDNHEILTQPYHLGREMTVPVYGMIGFAFLAGLAVAILTRLRYTAREWLRGWKVRRGLHAAADLETTYLEGVEAILNGQNERALALFQAVLERDPSHRAALLKAGEVARGLGRHEEAVKFHREAERLQPDDLRPLYGLAADYEAMGRPEQAREILERIIALHPRRPLTAYRKLRQIHMNNGDWAAAARVQEEIGRLVEQKTYAREAEHRFAVGIEYERGAALLKAGKARDAAAVFRRLVREEPKFTPAYLMWGRALERDGDLKEALEAWKHGFEATGSPVFLGAIEDHLLERESPRQAIELLESLARTARQPVVPRFHLGALFLRLEMIDEAHRQLDSIRHQADHLPMYHYYRGLALERRGSIAAAAQAYRLALERQDPPRIEYECAVCQKRYKRWVDRCDKCGEWDRVGMRLPPGSPPEEGISSAPVYTVSGG
jgi:lipopolysaccharide biosynthesis regulator YciM